MGGLGPGLAGSKAAVDCRLAFTGSLLTSQNTLVTNSRPATVLAKRNLFSTRDFNFTQMKAQLPHPKGKGGSSSFSLVGYTPNSWQDQCIRNSLGQAHGTFDARLSGWGTMFSLVVSKAEIRPIPYLRCCSGCDESLTAPEFTQPLLSCPCLPASGSGAGNRLADAWKLAKVER